MESVEEPEEETGKTEVLEPAADTEEPAEETGMTEILEGRETAGPGEEETGLTEVLDRVDEAADDQTAVVRARDLDLVDLDSDAETKEMPALSEAAPSGDDTAEVEALNEDDLNLDDLTRSFEEDDLDKTAEIPVAGQGPEGESLIEEIFGEEDEEAEAAAIGDIPTDAGDLESTRELPQPKPSDVTLSEVGTKLDLARAYLDMGDPDGARSILEEVVEEGDDAQQKEARELLDGLS
jgi:pilus assembly protein FimV